MMNLINEAEIMVFVTHDLEMAQNICNRVVLLDRGVLLDDGNPKDVIAHYRKIMEEESNG